jgi:hypothetical protein
MASRKARALLAAACVGSLALAACGKQGQDEMSWARAALERNAALELVASDPQARTFTVRMKDSGSLSVLRLDQIVAGPGPGTGATGAAMGAAPASAVAGAVTAPAATAVSTADSQASTPGEPASRGDLAAPPYRSSGEAAQAPAPQVFASKANPAHPSPGQVLEKGPGYTIEAASAPAAAAVSAGREGAAGASFELRHEPIVCQGARLLHIDNQNLQFEGDGLSAENGCEIHITNSRIRATGFGVSARAANVHIDNSLIEGDAGSIDASDGAQIYAASSRFRGLSRQLDTAAVHDLGGNVWN